MLAPNDYIDRQDVLALLTAVQDEQESSAKLEDEKAAGNEHIARACRHVVRILRAVAEGVRELPAATAGEKVDQMGLGRNYEEEE